jgi:3-hydroxyacyl-[acyl-carrier-protein] dehydratase
MDKTFKKILDRLPYQEPFLFVDGLTALTPDGVEGYYRFSPESSFYRGHFKDAPVTPGVILIECCAQIALACLGIYLSDPSCGPSKTPGTVALTESQMEFLKPVFPGERVTVRGEKVYFRFNKLKAKVCLYRADGQLACRGMVAGIFKHEVVP